MPCIYNPFSQLAAPSPVSHWGLAFTFYCENRRWHFRKQCVVSRTLTAARGGAGPSCYSSIFCICSGSRKWNSFLTAKAGQPFTSRDLCWQQQELLQCQTFLGIRVSDFCHHGSILFWLGHCGNVTVMLTVAGMQLKVVSHVLLFFKCVHLEIKYSFKHL